MINRKIEAELKAFLSRQGKEALLVSGARQVGKTFIIRDFAQKHYKHVVEINFIKTPKAKLLFEGATNEDEFFAMLSTLTSVPLKPGETLIFFDEVQACPEIMTFIKFLVDDGRYHYILSGSLLGIELKNIRSVPVGYLREVTLFPLDFEEFIRANGVAEEVIALVEKCCRAHSAIPPLIHEKLMKLFRLYLVVGGMPAVVQAYLDTNDLREVVRIQKAIMIEYKKDAARYDEAERMRIVRVFELIPAELNRPNKRFFINEVKGGGRFERLEDNFVWLDKAGIAIPVYNVDAPKIPLALAKKANLFKLFMNDVGLLSSQYAEGIQLRLLTDDAVINYGAIYENFVAQELRAHGYDTLYYFNSKKHGEVDFLIEKGDGVLPLEVKSGNDYKCHAALDNMLSVKEYALKEAKVLCKASEQEGGGLWYEPIYATMFIQHDPLPDRLIYKV